MVLARLQVSRRPDLGKELLHRLFRSRGSLPGLKLKGVPATVGIKQACALHHK